jgi:hypothetical protein
VGFSHVPGEIPFSFNISGLKYIVFDFGSYKPPNKSNSSLRDGLNFFEDRTILAL